MAAAFHDTRNTHYNWAELCGTAANNIMQLAGLPALACHWGINTTQASHSLHCRGHHRKCLTNLLQNGPIVQGVGALEHGMIMA